MNTHRIMTAGFCLASIAGTTIADPRLDFDAGDIGASAVYGDAAVDAQALLLTPDTTASAGSIVFDPTYSGAVEWFDATFDHIAYTNGSVGSVPTIFALGDLPDGTFNDPSTIQGLAVVFALDNIGGGVGSSELVSVWVDGVEVIPHAASGTSLGGSGWSSDAPFTVEMNQAGEITVTLPCSLADLNADGVLNLDDVNAFAIAFSAGCE